MVYWKKSPATIRQGSLWIKMIKMSFLNLFRFKARTALAALGIVIGVMAIVALVSVIDGLYADDEEAFAQVQGINVMQEGSFGGPFSVLDEDWGDKLKTIPGVQGAVPSIVGIPKSVEGEDLVSGAQFTSNTIRLIGQDWGELTESSAAGVQGEIIEGREIRAGEEGVVVIGEGLQDDYKKFVGNKIKVNGDNFRIVGVYRTGSLLLNYAILMPLENARQITGMQKGKVNLFIVDLIDPTEDKKVKQLIEFKYGDDLRTTAASDTAANVGSFLETFRLAVFAIAAISAIVAGVGIINTMLMSVLERFKEIGTLKAIGWTNNNVMKMILFESFFIGVIGAVLGTITGYGVAYAADAFFGLTTLVTPILIVEAFLFAVIVSLLAGVYPAHVASKMNPLDAIRAE
jgi:putative ABC transport system permease protein